MSAFLAATPALPVADMDRAVAFYAGVLGMALEHREGGFAILRRDAVAIHLWRAGDESWRARPDTAERPMETAAESFLAGTASARVRVDDLEGVHAACAAAGAGHPNGPLEAKPRWLTEFAALDPDGNCLAFCRPS